LGLRKVGPGKGGRIVQVEVVQKDCGGLRVWALKRMSRQVVARKVNQREGVWMDVKG
jgi:hypothetical protein